jgi:hypothetical protein
MLLPSAEKYPLAQNGLWAPFDVPACTTSATEEAAALDGKGPIYFAWKADFPGITSRSSARSFSTLFVEYCIFVI